MTAAGGSLDDRAKPVVADHELLRLIGSGAYGDVWLARNVTGAFRAVKVVWRSRFEHERSYEREFEGLKRYEPISRLHPGLTDVLQVGRDAGAGYFYYVLELADAAGVGGSPEDVSVAGYVPLTLGEWIRRRGRLPVAECVRIGAVVAEALEFLHGRGLVHRDIKPSNIIFVSGTPKLADIGLVAGLGDARSFVGTDGYIPPEGPGAPPADLFSLGKVLYEMVTGRSRLDFPDLPRELLDTPDAGAFAELNEIVLRACAPEVASRHATAGELRGELLLVDAGKSVRRLRRTVRVAAIWRRVGLVAVGVGLVAVVGVLVERDRAAKARELADAATRQRHQMEQKELEARQNLYAADMNLAQQALERGNFGRAEALLSAYEEGTGSAGLRGFEWWHFWNQTRGDAVGILRGHAHVVSSLALGPTGETVFSGGFDGSIREWSIGQRRQVREWLVPGCSVMALALDRNGTRLAVEWGNRPLTGLLDIRSGEWTTNSGWSSPSVAFAPGGDRVLRGARLFLFETNAVVEVVDTRLRVEQTLAESGGRAWFSRDGRMLATGTWGDAIKLWRWPGLEPAGQLDGAGLVLTASFSPDGGRLVSAGREGQLQVWDVGRCRLLKQCVAHGGSIIWSVAHSPDGSRVATGGNDQAVVLWDAATLEPLRELRGHGSEVWSVVWMPDGRQLVSGGKDQTLRIWDADHPTGPLGATNLTQAPVFSPDQRWVAIRTKGEGVRVQELRTGRLRRMLDAVEVGGFPTDGRSLTLLRDDRTYERRDLEDGRVLEAQTVRIPAGAFTRRVLSADGRWLVVGREDGEVFVQDLREGGGCRKLAGHGLMIVALEFSPDATRLLTGSLDRTACLWELETGRLLRTFEGHRMAVAAAAFSPDGGWLATGSWDDTVRLWEVGTGRLLGVLDGHSSAVHGVAIAPDRRTLAVVSGAGVLKFWSVAAGREAGVLALEKGPGLGWVRFSPEGSWLGVVSPGGRLRYLKGPESGLEKDR